MGKNVKHYIYPKTVVVYEMEVGLIWTLWKSKVKVIKWAWLKVTRMECPSKFQTSSQKPQGQFEKKVREKVQGVPQSQTAAHYENTPIQIYIENFTTQNRKFSDKILIFFIFLLKT